MALLFAVSSLFANMYFIIQSIIILQLHKSQSRNNRHNIELNNK